MNKVYLLGNLGADPELRHTQAGPVLKMRIATNETYFDKENAKQERLEWHNVTVFGRRAEGLSKILTKGFKVLVVGRMETSSYEKEGQKHFKTDVVAKEIFLAGSARESVRERAASPAHTNGAMHLAGAREANASIQDLPF